jgi:hypothetical protein
MANEKKAPEKTNSELMRRFKSNPPLVIGTFVVLVIVIIAFVLVPAIVPNAGDGDMDLTFGYYDTVPISYVPGNFFAQVVYSRQQQGRMDSDNASPTANRDIWRESFQEAAVHTAILREMYNSGYIVPEKLVDREVARLPQFQVNGRFSPVLYRQIDDNQRLSLWRQVQESLIKDHFSSDVAGLLKPAAEAQFIGAMASAQRSFDMVSFSVDAYPEIEYTTFIQESPELFRTIHLSLITISSGEREARQVLASIKNGETTFEDAARAFSKDYYANRGGDMGMRMVYELGFDISEETEREKVLALARGEYSNIIKTGNGWAFFRVEEPLQEADASDVEVMEKVRSYVRNYRRGRMEDWAITQADNFITLVNEAGFEDALFQQNLEKRSFGPVPLNYASLELFTTLKSQPVTELSGADSNENFWKIAFSTPVDSPSRPVVQGSNVLVLFPKEETEAEESVIENISSYYSSWLMYMPNWIIQQYFMNSPKMKDNFYEVYATYRRYFE